ncbi:2OG-Fe dioxygenase family protein [Streptomyces sp. NPDC059649]|uniref:2OG-Fe dioxygenase family protein n=1 Tax=Streptomyces sp. NPDC059649 TaxID=3346895 RepID=UPI0036A3115F
MDETASATPVATARTSLATAGAHLLPATVTKSLLAADRAAWTRFAAHWEELSPDRYAAELGTCRLRRYGQFSLTPATGELSHLPQLPDLPFVQPDRTNPLYDGVDRHFEPLTEAFAADPVLRAALALLGRLAGALDATVTTWNAKVHPFRVVAAADGAGNPTPEGRHRDGVTLVSSLLVNRHNATGGRSTVYAPDGRELLSVTLDEPAALLVADDRSTLHGVSPIRPLDPARTAHRDVLVTTLIPQIRSARSRAAGPPAGRERC